MKTSKAFTLLEVLLSLTIASMIFVALNYFVFSMGEVWGRGSDKRLFDQHVRAVSRFMERELRTAALPPARKAGSSAFTIEEIKPSGGLLENLITYELLDTSRLFTWPERPLPEIVCSLFVRENKGLFILYHSRLESNFAEEPPREVLVSPFVKGVSYEYYDPEMKRWTSEKTLKKDRTNAWMAPQRLLLKFSHKGLSRDILITLPAATEGLPRL